MARVFVKEHTVKSYYKEVKSKPKRKNLKNLLRMEYKKKKPKWKKERPIWGSKN